ncbi:hypothetical protein PROPEN_01310 [Proteus penneri ATCC 35198]|nr:hypothetical protein PROPEN_01310 [Proteus penneri ATCC 35198]
MINCAYCLLIIYLSSHIEILRCDPINIKKTKVFLMWGDWFSI